MLEAELDSLSHKPSTEEVLTAVLRAYNADTGESLLSGQLAREEQEKVGIWLADAEHSGVLLRKVPQLTHLPLFADLASKLSWLKQNPCGTCGPREGGGNFPIEMGPWTHQSSPEITKALRVAIAKRFGRREDCYASGVFLCIRLVFVLPGKARMKDCDNMAKGLLDALQGHLYENDDQIDHLSLIRMRDATTSSGYILVDHRPTTIGTHTDVLSRGEAKIAWMTDDALSLKDYL